MEEELKSIHVPDDFIIKAHPWMLQQPKEIETSEEKTSAVELTEEIKNYQTEINLPPFTNNVKFNLDWNEEDVNNWFKRRRINESIVECLTPCHGSLLKQLYITLIEIPEFFHSILRSDSKASLKDIVYFASELKLLFK